VVRRTRYARQLGSEEWSLPKGHLREDESPVDAALREVEEETGWRCVVLSEAGALRYRTEKEGPKEVRFWNMRTVCQVRSEPTPEEVAEVAWVSPKKALCTLTYSDQAHLLAYAFLQAGAIGTESPSAAYAVAFAAGFSERIVARAAESIST
jgi:8-oxo-dGTP diphosphatase